MIPISPKDFNLTSRSKLFVKDSNIVLQIHRKSRFLKKDAALFIDRMNMIKREFSKDLLLDLGETPLCSKAKKILNDNNIFPI